MPFEFEAVDFDEVKGKLTTRTRKSKWRENLNQFMLLNEAAIRIRTDDDEMKPASVSSGFNSAIKTAAKVGEPVPVVVKTATEDDGSKSVYLVRSDMVDLGTKQVAAEPEPVEA